MTVRNDRPPLSRRIQVRAMRVVNVPMRRVLALPFATPLSDRLMLLSVTGRRSGRSYRQPISYVRDGDALLTPGGGRWRLNLVEGRPERIRLRGRDVLARPEIVADADEVERLLAVMRRANPRLDSFVRIPRGADGNLDRDRLEAALRYGFRVIRWRLEPGSTPSPASG
jgi:F420H(2)-dependent quinone reductase